MNLRHHDAAGLALICWLAIGLGYLLGHWLAPWLSAIAEAFN